MDLQAINLLMPLNETRCMAGQKYYIFYNTTPSNLSLNDSNLNVSASVVSGDSLVSSIVVQSSGDHKQIQIVFKENVTGTVGVKMRIEDQNSGDVVESNTLELTVYNDSSQLWTGTHGTNVKGFTIDQETITMTQGQTRDFSECLTVGSNTQSKYFFLYVNSSSVYVSGVGWRPSPVIVGSDGTSLSVRTAGRATVCVETHVAYSNSSLDGATSYGGYMTKIDSMWKRFTVEAVDNPESLGVGNAMNLRFINPKANNAPLNEIVLDRSANIFYSSSRNGSLLEGTKYDWPYADEDGERDKRLILLDKYGVTNYEDLLAYDDPNGYFDSSRLDVWFENAAGERIRNNDYDGADVLTEWKAGKQIYLAAQYGSLDSTKAATYVRIPFSFETSNPNYIPVRDVWGSIHHTKAEILDFSEWHPMSDLIEVSPKDAILDCSEFSLGFPSEVAYIETINSNGKTLDERYRFRFAGIGKQEYNIRYVNNGIHHSGGPTITLRYDGSNADHPSGLQEWTKADLVPSKRSIKRGEYMAVKFVYTPDYDFTIYADIRVTRGIWFRIDNTGNWLSPEEVNEGNIFKIICASRKGVIVQGSTAASGEHVLTLRMGVKYVNSGSTTTQVDNTIDITLLDSTYISSGGTPTITAQTNSDGTLKDNTTVTLGNGTLFAWNSGEWRIASVQQNGLVRTYTKGTVTLYAVTTDGRLASRTFNTQSTLPAGTPEPEPETPPVIDTTLRPATDTSDDIILSFDSNSPIEFASPSDSSVTRTILKGSPNYDIRGVAVVSDNPQVATASASYNMNTGIMTATISPAGVGTTKVKIIYGGTSDSIDVTVLGNNPVGTPNLEYHQNKTGVSLNVYEYTDFEIKVKSQSVYDSMTLSTPSGVTGISGEKKGYNSSTEVATIRITLTEHVTSCVYVNYGSERLIISVANRFNLKFEDIQNFVIGIGATRNVYLYPLDDSVTLSSVRVYSEVGNVKIGQMIETTDDRNGKRAFQVPIECVREGEDTLVAHRKDDDNIYLNFTCEVDSVPASSIRFNQTSLTLSLNNN